MNKKILVLAIIFVVVLAIVAAPTITTRNEKHPVLDEIRRRFHIISPQYAKIPLRTGNRSYTENKNAITLCVVDPNTKGYYDIDVLMYVACHELAHVITKANGTLSHADEFKENFSRLLQEATQKGVYNPNKGVPISYCGSKN